MIQNIIQNVSEVKHKIVHNIKRQGIIKKYLYRQPLTRLIDPDNEEYLQNISIYNLSNDIETGKTVDWIAFNQIIDSSWKSLEFCGYEWDSTELVKKTLYLVWVYLIATELT